MRLRSSLLTLLLLVPFLCVAQDPDQRILIYVDGKTTEAGEFIRMYQKNIGPDKNISVDDYLRQYIIFKLKVTDAIREGYDTVSAFRTELSSYRNQVAQNYLTDRTTKEKILKAAYQRSLTEINAWHILIGLPDDPLPADTLKAWEKASDVRERILRGEPFEQVARSTSDDKSVLVNGGNIGYFTVFQMITPFEDAAYSMKKGEISEPVRSPYGYHIIRVADIRPSKGKIRVAHIMKSVPPGSGEEAIKKAEKEINDIYQLLLKGESFGKLAGEYSDHKSSAALGGEMDWFGTGEIITQFSEAAFSLNDTGSYTKPVRTPYGFHIIKLLDRIAPPSFDEAKEGLENKINQSYLNSSGRRSFIEQRKKEYGFRTDKNSFNWFVLNTDTLIIQGLKKYDRTDMPSGNIYTFAGQGLTNNEFADYIEKRGYIIDTKDSAAFISRTLDTRSADHLISYENSLLERKYPEFRYLMNEFHDGILMFEISADKVWNPVSEDTAGLMNYYETHKEDYMSEPGVAAKIYTLRIPGKHDELGASYRRYSRRRDPDNLMLRKYNRKKDSTLVITEGRWLRGQNKSIDSLDRVIGHQICTFDGYPSVAVISELIDPVPLEFESVQEEVINDFQEYLESSWIEQLKEKYNVKIDNSVLNEIKKRLVYE